MGLSTSLSPEKRRVNPLLYPDADAENKPPPSTASNISCSIHLTYIKTLTISPSLPAHHRAPNIATDSDSRHLKLRDQLGKRIDYFLVSAGGYDRRFLVRVNQEAMRKRTSEEEGESNMKN
jgi:hypothetical protein